MKKIENKFLYFILILIVFIIGFSIYISIFKKGVDRNSYVELIEGEGYINDLFLVKNHKHKLSINDTIRTTKENSLAIIEWGDGSVTRVGGNSYIKVNEMYVSDNRDKLNISFELFKGKTWSNVVSYVGEDSYFKQSFMDREAAIRGTIFNVDLDNDYLYVVEHKISLKKSNGEEIIVDEKKPIKLSNFNFIQLEEFIKNIRDNAFDEINRKFDKEFLEKLKKELQSKLADLIKISSSEFDKLSISEKELYYTQLYSSYQELNFVKSTDDIELYDLKLIIKNKLLEISPVSEQKLLMESFVYDLKDSINTKSYDSINFIIGVINDNSSIVNYKDEILEYLNTINLGDNLKSSFINNINILKSTFSKESLLNKDSLKDKALDLDDKIKNTIESGINTLIN